SLSAQVEFSLKLMPDGKTYHVYARPDSSITPSASLVTGSAQVTIVVNNGFQFNNFTSVSGAWDPQPARVNSPIENPTKDYISFGFQSEPPIITLQSGTETLLFTFKRTSPCIGISYLINNDTDPFAMLPNSVGSNPGNEISIIDFGNGFEVYEYTKNYGIPADCRDNDGDGIVNNLEDKNQNGVVDAGETNPNDIDTDDDGIADGVEDADRKDRKSTR